MKVKVSYKGGPELDAKLVMFLCGNSLARSKRFGTIRHLGLVGSP